MSGGKGAPSATRRAQDRPASSSLGSFSSSSSSSFSWSSQSSCFSSSSPSLPLPSSSSSPSPSSSSASRSSSSSSSSSQVIWRAILRGVAQASTGAARSRGRSINRPPRARAPGSFPRRRSRSGRRASLRGARTPPSRRGLRASAPRSARRSVGGRAGHSWPSALAGRTGHPHSTTCVWGRSRLPILALLAIASLLFSLRSQGALTRPSSRLRRGMCREP